MENPIIKKLIVKSEAKFTWLKYVTGADVSKHCAKSLIGTYEQNWKRDGNPDGCADGFVLPESPYYYFCAVTPRYKTNVHVAWVQKAGSSFTVDDDLVHIEVENAEQVKITPEFINWNLPQSKDWFFKSCRNWWFANYLEYGRDKEIRQPQEKPIP